MDAVKYERRFGRGAGPLPPKPWGTMRTYTKVTLLIILASLAASLARGEDDWTDTQIVEAIYRAEGGVKAQYLYGIRSVRYNTSAEARKICLNSVRNGYLKIRHKDYEHRIIAEKTLGRKLKNSDFFSSE